MMTATEAIRFLENHQPMPPDGAISEGLIAQYDEARRALEHDPDPRGLPLLLNSFGQGSGFGVYQLVEDAVRAYPRDEVVSELAKALGSPIASVHSWAMEIALEYPDVRLIPRAVALLASDDRDARYFAASYLVDLDSREARVIEALQRAARREEDEEIAELLREAVGSVEG